MVGQRGTALAHTTCTTGLWSAPMESDKELETPSAHSNEPGGSGGGTVPAGSGTAPAPSETPAPIAPPATTEEWWDFAWQLWVVCCLRAWVRGFSSLAPEEAATVVGQAVFEISTRCQFNPGRGTPLTFLVKVVRRRTCDEIRKKRRVWTAERLEDAVEDVAAKATPDVLAL